MSQDFSTLVFFVLVLAARFDFCQMSMCSTLGSVCSSDKKGKFFFVQFILPKNTRLDVLRDYIFSIDPSLVELVDVTP